LDLQTTPKLKMSAKSGIIPARRGAAVKLLKGQTIKVINTHGTQVVDTWAFNLHDPTEYMSMQHTRASITKLIPKVGDSLTSSLRKPILTLVEDTTPGIHDTLIAACDPARYAELGAKGYHESCAENLNDGLKSLGASCPFTPSPFNLFMNIPVKPDMSVSFEEATSKPGQYVALKAEMDVIVAFSACPQDILDINSGKPVDAHWEII